MPDPRARRQFDSLNVLATVLRSPVLLRVLLAFLLFNLVEAATWVAMLVYAYDQGGATASGVVAFAQLAPAVVFAPAAATMGDRTTRTRMLALAYISFAVATLVTAAFLLADLDPLIVYVAAVGCGLSLTLIRPAHGSVLPAIARVPSELTAANVASGTTENIGVFVGSVGGGLLLAMNGAGGVFLVSGIALLVAFLSVARLHVRPATTSAWERLDAAEAGGEPERGAGVAHEPGHRQDHQGPEFIAEMRDGLLAVRSNPLVRPVIVIVGLSFILQGAADVLQVVLAIEILGTGDGGVGVLGGAIGVGGLLGSAAAISLVGRRRLLRPMLVAAVVAGLGIAFSGLVPLVAVGIAGYAAVGAGRSLIDIVARTMLQRVTAERYLARVFGVLEGTALGGLAVGTLVAPVLVALAGPTAALVATGLIVPAGAVLLRAQLSRTDAAGVVHERELAAVRRTSMFAPLGIAVLERLAAHAASVTVAAGDVIIREGDEGDCFYMIESGRCSVTILGSRVNELGPGDSFGSIALLKDIPRTATVTALEAMELFGLERQPFLEAVAG